MTASRMLLPLLTGLALATLGALPAAAQAVPSAPIRAFWPDPAFDPAVQCRGDYAADVEAMLPRARLALSVPGTQSVGLDPTRRCIRVVAQDLESARFAALLMRGLDLPRRAILLELAFPDAEGRGSRPRGA